MLKTKEEILKAGKDSLTSDDYDAIYRTALEIHPERILEIGSRWGTSSMMFANILEKSGNLICIECDPQDEWFSNMKHFKRVKLLETYSPWYRIEDIPGDIDYLLIDGDHRTRFTIADYHYFSPFVRVGGRIAFHDTFTKLENMGFRVSRAIDIILEESDNLRLVVDTQSDFGVKVFEKTKDFS